MLDTKKITQGILGYLFILIVGLVTGISIFTWLGIIGIVILLINLAMIPKQKDDLKNSFYQECVQKGVRDLDSVTNREKAKAIAKRLNLSDDIDKLFARGKELNEVQKNEEVARKNRDKLAEIRREEAAKHAELTKYSEYEGTTKRVVMLREIQKEYEDTAKSLESAVNTALAGEKEIDWATHGGIASAIAGGAAGVAVASDIQAKNAQIRARNEANRGAMMPAAVMVYNSASEYRKKAKEMEKEIGEATRKLVEGSKPEDVLSYLSIYTRQVEFSETDTFTITAEIQLSAKLQHCFRIFGDVPAVVDGTISADLYQEGVKVGSALIVLPMMGIGENNKQILKGMCLLSNAKKNIPYEVKYTPYKLWAMEK